MRLNLIIVVAALGLLMSPALAAETSWIGGDGLWTTPGNWSSGVPTATTDVIMIQDGGSLNTISLLKDRTIGNLTFNSVINGPFTIGVSTTNALTLNGITVQANGQSNNIFGRVIMPNGGTIDVASGAALITGSSLSNLSYFGAGMTSTVTKNGLGTWTVAGGEHYNSGNTSTNYLGRLSVNAGTVNFPVVTAATSGTDIIFTQGIDLAEGAKINAPCNSLRLVANGASWGNSTIRDVLTTKNMMYNSPGMVTISGQYGQLIQGMNTGSGAGAQSQSNDGFITLDNTDYNVVDRFIGGHDYPMVYSFNLIGNDTAMSSQTIMKTTTQKPGQSGVVFQTRLYPQTIMHGSGTGANAFIANSGKGIQAQGNAMMVIYAKDHAGNFEALGNDADFKATGAWGAGVAKSYFFWGANSGEFIGAAAGQRVSPYMFVGAYGSSGSEFAAQLDTSSTVVQRYDGPRQTFASMTLATDNILETAGATLTAGKTINTLKLASDDAVVDTLNLGGSGLTIGTAKGSGIIVSGSAGAIISNGTLGISTNPIFLVTDTPLTIAADATLGGKSLMKAGTAKLTINGTMAMAANTINWYDGAIEYNAAANVTISGNQYGHAGTEMGGKAGLLTMGGPGTMTLTGINWGDGGMLITSGSVVVNKNLSNGAASPLGYGLTEMYNGSILSVSNGLLFGPIEAHDNALVKFTGGGASGLITLHDNAVITGGTRTLGGLDMSEHATGTLGNGGMLIGNLTMSGSTRIDATAGSNGYRVLGSIDLSGDAAVIVAGSGMFDYSNNWVPSGAITLKDNARFVATTTTAMHLTLYPGSGAVRLEGNSRMEMGAWNFAPTMTLIDGAVGSFHCSNGFNGNRNEGLTISNTANLSFTGDGYFSSLTATDQAVVTFGGADITGPISVGPDVTLALRNGTFKTDVSGVPANTTWGGGWWAGGNGGANQLILASTLTIPSGGRTFNVLPWADSSCTAPYVKLWTIAGSDNITVNGDQGAFGSGLMFTATSKTSTWTGNVNVNSGILHIPTDDAGNSVAPVGLDTINLIGSKLYLSGTSPTNYTHTIVGHTIAGSGTVYTGDWANLPEYKGKVVSAGGIWKAGNESIVGTLNVLGDLEFAMNGSTPAQVVIKASSGSVYSSLNVVATGTIGGNLTGLSNSKLTIDALQTGAANWDAFSGATLTVVSANDITGQTFAVSTDSKTGNTASPAGWTNEMRGVVSYSGTNVTVWNLHNTHQVGDGNGDLKVDIADYTLYFNNYGDKGAANAWYPGDLTGDGKVDIADYTAYFNNYGDHSAGHSAVPEPATMALLALGGLAILRRRK